MKPIGGKEKKHQHKKTKDTQGRPTKTKLPVVGMHSRDGRLVASKMNKVNRVNIQTMINNHVDNATICTDEAIIYKGIKGYKQLMVHHSTGQYVNGIVHTNGIERCLGTTKTRLQWCVSSFFRQTYRALC